MTAPPTRPTGLTGLTGLNRLTGLLALAGLLLALAVVLRPHSATGGVGTLRDTSFGEFGVVRVRSGFVPATQGAPTMRKMMGLTGHGRLQVWVHVENRHRTRGLVFDPADLVLEAPGRRARRPDGSTTVRTTLPVGSALDTQVWFDRAEVPRRGPRPWLRFSPSHEEVTRVRLDPNFATDPSGPTTHRH